MKPPICSFKAHDYISFILTFDFPYISDCSVIVLCHCSHDFSTSTSTFHIYAFPSSLKVGKA